MAKHIEELVEEVVVTCLAGMPLELVDVEYVREREWFLRVYIDKPGGVDLDDCQWLSHQLSDKLDETDFIKDSYHLEVSSPGIDRVLKKPRDFVRHMGQQVEVNLFAPLNGNKKIVGILKGVDDQALLVEQAGVELAIQQDKIAQVRLYVEF